jgi:transposase InsO family protein/transposase-like protein
MDRGVRLALESERPITGTARDLGVHPEALRKRVRQAEADAGNRSDILASREREGVRKLRKENFELRRANEILKSASVFCRGARPRPSEVSRYVDEHRAAASGSSRSAGPWACRRPRTTSGPRASAQPRAVEHERLLGVTRATHKKNYEATGTGALEGAAAGRERVPRCQVQRLMREHEIRGAKRRSKPWRPTKADPDARRPADLVNRNFTATAPNPVVGRGSVVSALLGRRRLLGVRDRRFSRRVVGWQLASHMRTDLVLDALRMALCTRQPGADFRLFAHTDRGSQYTSTDYTQVLDDHNVLASVGSVGDAYDNAMAESFVDSFKTELITDRVWRTRAQLELAVVEYISWFNRDRLHESLGDIPPVEFEALDAQRVRAIAR